MAFEIEELEEISTPWNSFDTGAVAGIAGGLALVGLALLIAC